MIQTDQIKESYGELLLKLPKITDLKHLDVDKSTPDYHVKRDERMIRLTGIHPFNSEAPLGLLRDQGFLTPQNLFFVRNHGSVPKIDQPTKWTVEISGLVENPISVDLQTILNLDQISFPATIVCAGNRRKEQNIVKKGNGFNWGSAGCSTAIFTGTLLSNLISLASPSKTAKYICMEGRDVLPNGNYGTCVSLKWVMDPARKIILAHKMNGEQLAPDHGYPLRVIVPGCIGGRSVKWLTKLIVTDAPSENYYHIFDNRVLPTMVTPQMAKDDKGWWKDERYAIYHLNVQSVITFPAPEDVLPLDGDTLEISGYAYSGGGRRIGRVEISLDKGATWFLTDITYPEDDFRELNGSMMFGGKVDLDIEYCYAWCFWKIVVDTSLVRTAKDIVVRAMDDGMNVQPRDMYWNLLSMLNNCWHRVAIHHEGDKFRFEHPCAPALNPGGWMERVKASGGNLLGQDWGETNPDTKSTPVSRLSQEISLVNSSVTNVYSREEVSRHNTENDCWFIVQNQVYDATPFLKFHPGGSESIVLVAGTDATDDFIAIHSESALAMMKDYHIGILDILLSSVLASLPTLKLETPKLLDDFNWKACKLLSKKQASPNVILFTFELEHSLQVLGLATGKHVYCRMKGLDENYVMRAYTPISPPGMKGAFQLLVKLYLPNPPHFPNGGKMSTLFDALIPGSDSIEVKGPIGSFEYLGNGRLSYKGKENIVDRFCMVAGGSGITPIHQVLHAVMSDDSDKTKCSLLFANRTVDDILCKKELDQWKTDSRFDMQHALASPPPAWEGIAGHLNQTVMEKYFGPPADKMMLLICGPPGLHKVIREGALSLGWDSSQDIKVRLPSSVVSGSISDQSGYWTVSFGQAVRTGFSCRECKAIIPLGADIAVRDGRKMRLFYHRDCYSGDPDPRSQSKSSFHLSGHLKIAIQEQAPAVKGRGKWSTKAYGYDPNLSALIKK